MIGQTVSVVHYDVDEHEYLLMTVGKAAARVSSLTKLSFVSR